MNRIKSRPCTIEGCNNPRFKDGKCMNHQERKKIKTNSRLKPGVKSEENIKEEKEQRLRDFEFYNSIWNIRNHNCEVCSKYLGEELLSIFFDHLLEKELYPQFRYNLDNILLVCGDCHTNKTNGFPKEKHKQAIIRAEKLLLNK